MSQEGVSNLIYSFPISKFEIFLRRFIFKSFPFILIWVFFSLVLGFENIVLMNLVGSKPCYNS